MASNVASALIPEKSDLKGDENLSSKTNMESSGEGLRIHHSSAWRTTNDATAWDQAGIETLVETSFKALTARLTICTVL